MTCCEGAIMRKPFSLTYVTYEPGDRIGEACAILALAPIFIVVVYATLLISRREVHLVYILVGQLLNLVLNAVLKAVINQPRPTGSDHPGPGMPSDHSQFMSFWACYGALFLLVHVKRVGRPGWRPALAASMLILAVAVAASRVYLGYHTVEQVLAGLAVGSSVAVVWFVGYAKGVRPHIRGWVGHPVCRYLMVRDCSHLEDVIAFEYEVTLARFQKEE